MKRSEALIELSREHHFGLLLVWKIRQGQRLNVAPERIASYTEKIFGELLAEHFLEEERYVYSILPEDHPLRMQGLNEHDELRSLVNRISLTAGGNNLGIFAHVLESHIRFEERELFSFLQDYFPKELEAAHSMMPKHGPITEPLWHDPFWEQKPL